MRLALCLLGLVLPPYMAAGDVETRAVEPASRDSLAALLKDLRSGDAETRIHAAKALYELGPRAAPAARALIAALADPDDKVREHVVDALTRIGPLAFRPLAIAVMKDDKKKRLLAIDVCDRISVSSKVGEEVKDISPALIKCLSEVDPLIKKAAIRCLGDLRAGSSVPRLVKLLEEEEDIDLRWEAIVSCGQIGKEAKQAIPILAKMVVSGHSKIVGNGTIGGVAASALAGIGEPAIPALARLITDVKLKPEIRCGVLSALGRESMVREVKFPAAAPAICKALADRDEEVRLTAIYALHALDCTDKNVRATLRAALTTDSSTRVRIDAAEKLYQSERQIEAILPTLMLALDDKEAGVRHRACSALMRIGRRANAAVPVLIRLVNDKDSDVRLAAIRALGQMGRSIAPAIPALRLATTDPDPSVQNAAEEALKQAKRALQKP